MAYLDAVLARAAWKPAARASVGAASEVMSGVTICHGGYVTVARRSACSALFYPPSPMAAPRRQVVVDDTDPAIQYTGPWLVDQGSTANSGNFGPAYLNTLHTINDNGSLSFSFHGKYTTLSKCSLSRIHTSLSHRHGYQCPRL